MNEYRGKRAGGGWRVGLSRVSSLPVLLLLAVLQQGCAYTQPYVNPFAPAPKPKSKSQDEQQTGPPSIPEPIRKELPTTSEAVDAAYLWAREVQRKREEITSLHRGLDLATFGLTVGAVAAPIFKAHRDTITALILGSGTTYAGNTLFVPVDLAQLYGGAAKALGCVSGKGRGVLQVVPPEPSLLAFEQKFRTDVQGVIERCKIKHVELTQRVQSSYENARLSLERVLANDFAAGQKLRQSAENVLHALNEEIDKRAPSAEAIVAAARSVGGLVGLALPKTPEPTTEDKTKPTARGPDTVKPCSETDAKLLAAQASMYERLQKSLDAALEQIESLDTACTFAPASLPDLAMNDDPVVLTQGEVYTIRVTGGRKPYRALWQGLPPTGDIEPIPEVFTEQLQIRGTAELKSDKKYTLLIMDSSAVTKSKTISVTTKRAS